MTIKSHLVDLHQRHIYPPKSALKGGASNASGKLAHQPYRVIEAKGGIGATDGTGDRRVLPLPIAGLMSQSDGYALAQDYARLDAWSKSTLGCSLRAPFTALSILALPVISNLKRQIWDCSMWSNLRLRLSFRSDSLNCVTNITCR